MTKSDIRPAGQKFAMAMVRSTFGLKLSRLGARKGATSILDGVFNDTV
jgi:hypothetical protein